MPALARDFQVVAVDQRGIGLSDKPEDGYDTATLADDLVALMDALGHERFAVVGCDTGMVIAYAVAADHPDRVDRLVVGEAPLPGVSPPAPLFLPPQVNDRLWHIPFNQLDEGERAARHGAGGHLLRRRVLRLGRHEEAARRRRHGTTSTRCSSPEALHGSFQLYRAFTATRRAERAAQGAAADDARARDRRRGELGEDGRATR